MLETIIYRPLGTLLEWIYFLVQNYGVAIIIFTVLTKMVLMPLTLKQQKSMIHMNLLKPKMDAIQKKYQNDKDKQSQEMMKLYQQHKINPMSGCLPLLIQLPIIYALYRVVIKPLTYIIKMPDAELISHAQTILNNPAITAVNQIPYGKEISIAKALNLINFNFLGLDLSLIPREAGLNLIWIIPLIAAGTTFLASKLTNVGSEDKKEKKQAQIQKSTRPPRPGEKSQNQGEQMSKMMTTFMPFMTLFISFTLPAGISIYWIAGNIIQIVQQYCMNKIFIPKLKEKAAVENVESVRKTRKKRR